MYKKLRRNMKLAMSIFVALFVILIGYLGYSVLVYGRKWMATPYNPRLKNAISAVDGGSIYDRNGVKLAFTVGGKRYYHMEESIRRACSHIIGDIYGKTVGAETMFADYIYGMNKSIFDRIEEALSGEQGEGSDIALTIDANLSKYIYKNMDGRRGSVVVMNYQTGEILADVNILTFDPSTVNTDELEESSLVNRGTMGRYPPGSIMKIVTVSAALKEHVDLTYECTGECYIDGQKVTCVKAHGVQNLKDAFKNSCNTYFANLSVKLGGERLLSEADRFGFNKTFNFEDIILYASSFEISDSAGDVAWAGIGQYKDLITPLHAAMMAGAVANEGVMMEPLLLKSVDGGNNAGFRFSPETYRRVMDADTAATLKDYMKEVVVSGTGTSAAVSGYTVYGKTGTAEYYDEEENIKNHSWFVGFLDEEHPYAVAVIFEGAGYGSKYAAPMAAKVFKYLVG